VLKPVQSRAEKYFAKNQNKDRQIHAEREKARQETLKQMARLRALRLAVEAADEKTAKETVPAKATTKKTKPSPG
jgi:hypothetical protein